MKIEVRLMNGYYVQRLFELYSFMTIFSSISLTIHVMKFLRCQFQLRLFLKEEKTREKKILNQSFSFKAIVVLNQVKKKLKLNEIDCVSKNNLTIQIFF
jgi:hypothetical protein